MVLGTSANPLNFNHFDDYFTQDFQQSAKFGVQNDALGAGLSNKRRNKSSPPRLPFTPFAAAESPPSTEISLGPLTLWERIEFDQFTRERWEEQEDLFWSEIQNDPISPPGLWEEKTPSSGPPPAADNLERSPLRENQPNAPSSQWGSTHRVK